MRAGDEIISEAPRRSRSDLLDLDWMMGDDGMMG
jgi:hypothetical protein